MHLILASLAVIAVVAPASAVDMAKPYIDLRVTIGTAAGLSTVTTSGGSTGYDRDPGGQLAVEGIVRQRFSRRIGYCAGLGLFVSGHLGKDQNDHDVQLNYGAAGIELTAGLTAQIVHGFDLEVRPFYRFGRGALHITNDGNGPTADEDGDSGFYHAAGALLGGYYTFPFGLQLGGQIGVEGFSGESAMNAGTVTVEGDGGFLRMTVGYSF